MLPPVSGASLPFDAERCRATRGRPRPPAPEDIGEEQPPALPAHPGAARAPL